MVACCGKLSASCAEGQRGSSWRASGRKDAAAPQRCCVQCSMSPRAGKAAVERTGAVAAEGPCWQLMLGSAIAAGGVPVLAAVACTPSSCGTIGLLQPVLAAALLGHDCSPLTLQQATVAVAANGRDKEHAKSTCATRTVCQAQAAVQACCGDTRLAMQHCRHVHIGPCRGSTMVACTQPHTAGRAVCTQLQAAVCMILLRLVHRPAACHCLTCVW